MKKKKITKKAVSKKMIAHAVALTVGSMYMSICTPVAIQAMFQML